MDILVLFFNLVSVIASTLCFFVLWLSFTANIRENSWEFGVLRAIGLSANQVTRVYIYEALAIILRYACFIIEFIIAFVGRTSCGLYILLLCCSGGIGLFFSFDGNCVITAYHESDHPYCLL